MQVEGAAVYMTVLGLLARVALAVVVLEEKQPTELLEPLILEAVVEAVVILA
jgi:hypothetical protein